MPSAASPPDGFGLIVIGDEMTGDLDSETGFEVMRLIRQLNQEQGKTVIFVTHDPEIAAYSRRVIHIRDGLIEMDEAAQNLLLDCDPGENGIAELYQETVRS